VQESAKYCIVKGGHGGGQNHLSAGCRATKVQRGEWWFPSSKLRGTPARWKAGISSRIPLQKEKGAFDIRGGGSAGNKLLLGVDVRKKYRPRSGKVGGDFDKGRKMLWPLRALRGGFGKEKKKNHWPGIDLRILGSKKKRGWVS